MAARTLRAELDALRAELARLREAPVMAEAEAGAAHAAHGIEGVLAEAEALVRKHPVAAAAGALALGIVLGRILTR